MLKYKTDYMIIVPYYLDIFWAHISCVWEFF